MRTPHIGKAIENRLQELGMTKADFARRIQTSRQNVGIILQRSTIQVDLLAKICDVLNYDFFADIRHGAKRPSRKVWVSFEVDSDALPPHLFEGF